SVARRSREIGIRMALGADRGRVVGMVLKQGGRLILIGMILGIAGGLALGSLVESML
ncbi:MAG: FtsX-like permease family protein, partial [Gammaproteobacteria bacterium]|nr:FtsX-like permease family protein [Gemmatimonadota bacterium]NIU78227.1 FtsX-like permease family protein [Gammaproteobacteria bacterium]